MSTMIIQGGLVLTEAEGLVETSVRVEDGLIAGLGQTARPSDRIVPARGRLVLPGIIDLHGDAFERQWMPRAGVRFPLAPALLETDRQMAGSGLTTAFHSLTLSWEPGLRGDESADTFIDVLERLRPELMVETRFHLRFEVYHLAAEEKVLGWLDQGLIDLLAFNDHVRHIGTILEKPDRLSTLTGRTGLSPVEYEALFHQVRSREAGVRPLIERLAARARELAVPMASHDDETPEIREWYHALGAHICEFPVGWRTTRAAGAIGDPIALGSPNVVNGFSQYNRVSAREAIAQGLGQILTSDYYYPSLPAAAFILINEGIRTVDRAWDLVSANPAEAAGLGDRGRLAEGLRADLILVDDRTGAYPKVTATMVGGRLVHASDRALSGWLGKAG